MIRKEIKAASVDAYNRIVFFISGDGNASNAMAAIQYSDHPRDAAALGRVSVGLRTPSGVHGMAWASSAGDHEHLIRVREDGLVSYYIHRNMRYRAANQPVPGVIYGFFRDRLFAVYIKLRSPNQGYYLEKRFSAEYGAAKVKMNKTGNRTIYRWKKDDIKIKLKIEENDGDLKLGIYYIPFAAQLNQAFREDAPSDLYRHAPAKDQSTMSAPLL